MAGMTIGQRLRRAIERAGLTQKEIAMRAGLEPATVSDIMNDRTRPTFATVERMVVAIGTTFGELFDEPRIYLSEEDAAVAHKFVALLNRLIANDAAQKALREPQPARRRRPDQVKDEPVVSRPGDELVLLPNEPITERQFRQGARRAFKVTTDAMIGAGILDGDVVFVRPTVDLASADGEIVVCRLDGALYLKRLELRGRQTALLNTNPRYPDIIVRETDSFVLIGVVIVGR
jgi:transcriptional regulator with XRE-family HTH domain